MAANKKISELTGSGALTGTELVPIVQDGTTLRTTTQAIADLAGAGAGTVTSVAASVPDFLSIAGSPITTSGTLAISYSGTALPIANGGTGLTALGTGVQTWFGTPSSANLAAAITDETGAGSLVFASAPTLTNPVVGTQSPGDNSTKAASTAYVDAAVAAAGGGSVTSVSVVTANGVSGSVATATTTPAITLTLGAITPTSVAASGAVSGSNLSGTNTGDQTITLTGDVTGSGTGSFATSLAATGVAAGSYTAANITVGADGRISLASSSGGLPAIPLDFKDSVDVATTANITLSGEQTIDGVLTSASRVLVKDQTTGANNGIYVSAAGAWSRSTDADISAEVTSGLLVYVEGGTVNGGLIYTLSTPDPITLGTTALTFVAMVLPFNAFVGKTVAGTTYTHILTDSGKRLNCTNAGTKTITVAPQASVNSAVNTEIEVHNAGAGLLTLAPGSGVTLNALNGTLTVPQYHCVKLKKRANPNTWDVTGIGLSAAVATFIGTPSSANLAAAVTDETGSGALVFGTSPTLTTPNLGTPSALTLTNATGLLVAGGGTGVASLTAYAPIFGGTTSTGAIQSGTVGTAGQVLTSNGAGAIATMQSQPFDVHVFYPGLPTASAKLVRVPVARAVAFPANFAGSYFKASANATASTVFDVQKNGSSIGTVTIGAGGTTATFATSGGSAQSLAAGDLLAIIAPASPDATLADPGFVLVGTR